MSHLENTGDPLNVRGLPEGLPEPIYATWVGALRQLKDSPSTAIGTERYHFCSGYTQALQDSGLMESWFCRRLNDEIHEIWIETLTSLLQRGL